MLQKPAHHITLNIHKMRALQLLIILLYLAVLYACKKGDGPDKQPSNCKLTSLLLYPAGQAQQTVSFLYDDDGRVRFINQDGVINEFIYQDNAFTRARPSPGNWVTRSYIQLNADGRPSLRKDTTYNNQSINSTAAMTYEYNSRGELEKGISNNASVIPNLSIVWQNGNMVSITEGNTTVFLDYYTDKPDQELTIMGLKFFIEFAAYAPKCKNLLKSLTSGSQQINFNYEFDEKGKIKATTWTVAGNPTPVATWQQLWDCN